MRITFIRRFLTLVFAVLALLTVCAVHPGARADEGPTETIKFEFGSLGIVRGQTLRYSWSLITTMPRSGNLNDTEPQFEPFRVQARLLASDGSAIAQAETTTISYGQIQSLDFNRGRINVPGELGTDRLQAVLEVEVTIRRGSWITDTSFERAFIKSFVDVVEIIDDASGRTTTALGGGKNALSLDDSPGNESLNPKSFPVISAGSDRMFGLASGETVRFMTFVPNDPVSTEQTRQVSFVQVLLMDATGTQIAQSDEIAIPPGESRSIDFNRNDLPLTGRMQIRARVRYRTFSLIDRTQFSATTSIELLDTATGRTLVAFPGFVGGVNVATGDVND
jgi:hypothetical protein